MEVQHIVLEDRERKLRGRSTAAALQLDAALYRWHVDLVILDEDLNAIGQIGREAGQGHLLAAADACNRLGDN